MALIARVERLMTRYVHAAHVCAATADVRQPSVYREFISAYMQAASQIHAAELAACAVPANADGRAILSAASEARAALAVMTHVEDAFSAGCETTQAMGALLEDAHASGAPLPVADVTRLQALWTALAHKRAAGAEAGFRAEQALRRLLLELQHPLPTA